MSALLDSLLTRIARTGPMTLAEFMTESLLHPAHGYYTTRDPLGASGDFTTAPEISQMFGELLGLWLAQVWMDQGAPAPFLLAELGPGRGTLMADVLRATRAVPGFHDAARLHLVEVSPALRARQAEALTGHEVSFHDHLASLPDGPIFLLANEFFDALPIRQFQRGKTGWHERMIGAEDGRLIWGLGPDTALEMLEDRLTETTRGQIVEVNTPALPLAEDIGRRITDYGGAALIVDYGEAMSHGDTFQALKAHKPVDPLTCPGEADLTAHVAFAPLAKAAAPARASAPTPQGVFLERLGITARAQALASRLSGPALDSHIAAHRRLTHGQEMGTLFKVMSLTPPDAALPPGLDP
ncbi:class I SAM-dependent methyltransferase [Nioella sediminis]|jgi:SAM-dependent MidA family methyltransferase|uniref:class I SAM-dependent methyltransferase n=1 Tax=Nioella sediminis TaxID=1912092 RepID=UPI0008FD619A|nr:SAM-dependent methyltransferase [Nioella sediminis]TBX29254.1 ATP synthase subunit beta [Roseovarius sp. JS7-11]